MNKAAYNKSIHRMRNNLRTCYYCRRQDEQKGGSILKRLLFAVLLFFLFSFVDSYARAEIMPVFDIGIFGGSVADKCP